MSSRTRAESPYMQFAKLRSGATYHLGGSGIASYPLRELPVSIDDLEINGPTLYGYEPLKERIAKLNAVTPDHVVCAAGASMANHLALAAMIEPGEEALVEWPTYELLVRTLEYLGARVRYFERRMEDEFRVDIDEVARRMTPQTRVIVLTNLHNPSGALLEDETLREVGEIAKKNEARVLVDEVYLEAVYEQRPLASVHLGEQFVVTSSLTKAFGLSGLRCGWILAEPALAWRMWHINDLYGVNAAHPAELLSVIAFDNLARVAARAKTFLIPNHAELAAFLGSRDDVACVRPMYGTVAFPKLLRGSVEDLHRLLRDKYDTSIVPGSFFGMPQHFRIGIGGEPEMTREGLSRLGCALDELGAREAV